MMSLTSYGRRRAAGFTLLELMIVVVIIAVLAAIAIPAYGRYAYRARRPDGQELLMRAATAQERYYATYNTYAASVTNDLKFSSNLSEKQYYQVAITPLGTDYTTGFTASATPQGAQAADKCGVLSIDSHGVKGPVSTDAGKNSNGNCW
jgi:type IV pilus assembly protein PilE